METVDIITAKRDGEALDADRIRRLVRGYVAGDIPDYQMAAFAMAVYFRGMEPGEILALTEAMADSGDTLAISRQLGHSVVDKHSTGGVGDKTTLVLAPLVAAAGVTVVKMSGRGLGHTGGTVDKLASIPGFRTHLDAAEIFSVARSTGAVIVSQMESLVPADAKLYALRDATATVESLPLIASSIMSKKLAVGADALVLDVKSGAGALMQTEERARELARLMVDIGAGAGKRITALVTDMDQPLGWAVGNALEVREALQTLAGEGPQDLRELSMALGAHIMVLAGAAEDLEAARRSLVEVLKSGAALEKMGKMVAAQGGDARVIHDPSLLPESETVHTVRSPSAGFVHRVDARRIGQLSMALGAGRTRIDSGFDSGAGILLRGKIGDPIHRGDPLAELHCGRGAVGDIDDLQRRLLEAFEFGDAPPPVPALIKDTVTPSIRSGEDR